MSALPTTADESARLQRERIALPWIGTASFILLMELACRLELLPSRFVPPPSVMATALVGLLASPAFYAALWATLTGWATSLALATVIGLIVGLAMGTSQIVNASLRLIVEFLRPIPSVALIPAAILLIGANVESKIYLAAFSALWPILIQTIYGVRDVEPLATDTARAFGTPRWRLWFRIILPLASPYIWTGLRIGSAIALMVVVTMEIVVGVDGVGQLMVSARQAANVPVVYAVILAAGLLGWAQNVGFASLEARVLSWHPSFRTVQR